MQTSFNILDLRKNVLDLRMHVRIPVKRRNVERHVKLSLPPKKKITKRKVSKRRSKQ